MVFRAQPLPGDLNRRPEAPGPDLQLENSPIEPDPPAHCRTVKNYRGGTAENNYSAGKIFYIQKRTERAHFLFWPARTNMEGVGGGRGNNKYACWRLRVRIPLCTCDFFCWLLVLWGASRSARKKASCARPHWRKLRVWGLVAGRLFSRFFSMRVLRFIMLGDCWGQKHGFRPRCTGRAPEWSPKREMPVLASQALATDPFPRFFQARPARKLRLTDPKCSSAATQISPTRLKPPKMTVFAAISPQRVFSRISLCQPVGLDLMHRLRANIGCETWLRLRVASRPKGTFGALKRAHMGTPTHVLAR